MALVGDIPVLPMPTERSCTARTGRGLITAMVGLDEVKQLLGVRPSRVRMRLPTLGGYMMGALNRDSDGCATVSRLPVRFEVVRWTGGVVDRSWYRP